VWVRVSLREQRSMTVLARQMARMSLFQIVTVLIFQLPYGVAAAYFLSITTLSKSPIHQIQDKLTQAF